MRFMKNFITRHLLQLKHRIKLVMCKEIKLPKLTVEKRNFSDAGTYFFVAGVSNFLKANKTDDEVPNGLFRIMTYWNESFKFRGYGPSNEEMKMIEAHTTLFLNEVIENGKVKKLSNSENKEK